MDTLLAILARLKGIKKIHDESPSIQQNVDAITEREKLIQESNANNKSDAAALKAELNKEFAAILKDLDE